MEECSELIEYIYCIVNRSNGRFYLGVTKDPKKRKREHWWLLNNDIRHSFVLQRAWDKYGADQFCFVVIDSIRARVAKFYEEYLMMNCKPDYNVASRSNYSRYKRIVTVQSANKSRKFTEQHKENISKALTGRELSP